MNKKSIYSLKTIFLDTGILVDLLRVDFKGASDETINRISITKKLIVTIDEFSKDAVFQTSAINVAELFHFDGDGGTVIEAMLTVLKGSQFEIISFDETNALFHNQCFGAMAGNAVVNELKKAVNYDRGNGFANIKDRIRKDMLIASAAKLYQSDITITNDSGFFDLCNRLAVPCHCMTDNITDFQTSNGGAKIYNWAL